MSEAFINWLDFGHTIPPADNVIRAGKRWCKRGQHAAAPGEEISEHRAPKIEGLDPDWFGSCAWCNAYLRRYADSGQVVEADRDGNVDFYKYKAPF